MRNAIISDITILLTPNFIASIDIANSIGLNITVLYNTKPYCILYALHN